MVRFGLRLRTSGVIFSDASVELSPTHVAGTLQLSCLRTSEMIGSDASIELPPTHVAGTLRLSCLRTSEAICPNVSAWLPPTSTRCPSVLLNVWFSLEGTHLNRS